MMEAEPPAMQDVFCLLSIANLRDSLYDIHLAQFPGSYEAASRLCWTNFALTSLTQPNLLSSPLPPSLPDIWQWV